MATTYSGTFKNTVDSKIVNGQDMDANITENPLQTYKREYANGAGSKAAQMHWWHTGSLLTTTAETLDMKALVQAALGTVAFTKIKEILIVVKTETAGYRLEIGDDAATANKWSACFKADTDIVVIPSGGVFHIASPIDGWTVDATHKLLKIYNPSGGTVDYDIILVGNGARA